MPSVSLRGLVSAGIVLLLTFGLLTAAPVAATAAVILGATTTTVANPTQLTIGEITQYTLTVTLPAGISYYDAAVIDTVSLGMTPVGGSTLSCFSGATSCTADLPGSATGYALAASGQKIGWYLGTVAASGSAKTITITFSVRLDDVARNAIAGNPTNAALVAWNTAAGSRPANAAATFVNTGPTSSLVVRVKEPSLSITSTISDSTPEPGDSFSYRTTVTNANAVYSSSAFAVTVTAAVPEGVIVDQSSITGGGVLSGGVITWTLAAAIAKNGSVNLDWSARLAATSTLTEQALVTTSRITHYQSLASGGRSYPSTPVTAAATATPDLPGLSVTKAAASGTLAYTSQPFAWVITVTNSGRSAATNVAIDDLLPANWSYLAGSASVSVNSAAPVVVGATTSTSQSRQTVSWADLGTLQPGQTLSLRYSATPAAAALVNPGAGLAIDHVNTAQASAQDRTGATGSAIRLFTGSAAATAHIASADLSLRFTVEASPVAGNADPRAWTITVTNLGPDAASGPFVVTETPEITVGAHTTSASGDGWSCTTPNPLNGRYSCTRADANEVLPPGATFPEIVVAAALDADLAAGTVLRTTVEVTSATRDANAANNTAIGTATVISTADLVIDVQAVGTLSAGELATWSVDVGNSGPSVALQPVVVDLTLPPAVGSVVAEGTGWTCTTVAPIRCTSAVELAVTSAPRITITGLVPSSFTGSMTTTAEVGSASGDPFMPNNVDSVTTAIRSQTTVLFEKRLNGTTLVPGTTAQYVFTVENAGFADATGVIVEDELPNGLQYLGVASASAAAWGCAETSVAPSTFHCSLSGSLPTGSPQTVTISVFVPSSSTGTITNTATASATNAPAVASTDGSQLFDEIDLGVTKTHTAGPVYAGTDMQYTVTVHNYGPTDASAGVVMTDTVPTGFTAVAASGSDWDCAAAVGQVLSCVSTAALAAGASSTIVVLASVPADAGGASYSSGALVAAISNEPTVDVHDNFALDTVDVEERAVVMIVRSLVSVSLTAGESIDYTIVVSNAGPSVAEALVVTGILPHGFTATAYTGVGWDCSTETLVCTRASLDAGTSVLVITVTLSSDIPDGTAVENTAVLSWTDSRADRNTDTATVDVSVTTEADLVLTKSAQDATPNAGENLLFDFTVQNNGPSNAVGPIVITDVLPSGLSFVSAGAGWTCTADPPTPPAQQTVVCTVDDGDGVVADGTTVDLTIVVVSDATRGAGAIINTANLSSGTTELFAADNVASATLQFDTEADLGFLPAQPGSARIGGVTAVTVVVQNDGPSTSLPATVEVALATGLRYVSVASSASDWTCAADAAATNIVCMQSLSLAALTDSAELVLNVAIDAAAYPDATLSLTVSSGTGDPDVANNAAVVSLPIDPLVESSLAKEHINEPIVGGPLDYLLTVSNEGPTEDPGGFTVTDTLPAGLIYEGFDGVDVTCAYTSPTVVCTFAGALAVGETRSVTIMTRVLSSGPTVVNTAELSSLFEQLSTGSLQASDSVVVLSALPLTGSTVAQLAAALALLLLVLGAVTRLPSARRRAVAT